jgi:hypothetical protein
VAWGYGMQVEMLLLFLLLEALIKSSSKVKKNSSSAPGSAHHHIHSCRKFDKGFCFVCSAINLQDDEIMVLALPTRRLGKPPEKSCMPVKPKMRSKCCRKS